MKKTLITGGCGYIGSHVVIELLKKKIDVVIFDNLSNSSIETIDKIKKVTGCSPKFFEGDIRNAYDLKKVFDQYNIGSVMHFAGLKSVSESYLMPEQYYENNVNGTINLIEIMDLNNIKNFIFSSSAAVYDENLEPPFIEDSINLSPISPYGKTKLSVERYLQELPIKENNWSIIILRYFNPIGAHSSGIIGECISKNSENLMPAIIKTAKKEKKVLRIYGDDYATKDGTCVRDFIHISDLVSGHIESLKYSFKKAKNLEIFNLGSGVGHTVLEVIKTFESVNGVPIPYKICDRREGDIAVSLADISRAKKTLDWYPKKSLSEMCLDSWRYENR